MNSAALRVFAGASASVAGASVPVLVRWRSMSVDVLRLASVEVAAGPGFALRSVGPAFVRTAGQPLHFLS
jgi:hypothetical protein